MAGITDQEADRRAEGMRLQNERDANRVERIFSAFQGAPALGAGVKNAAFTADQEISNSKALANASLKSVRDDVGGGVPRMKGLPASGSLMNRMWETLANSPVSLKGTGVGWAKTNEETAPAATAEPATDRTEPATDRPERTPIDTGAMGRATTVEGAMGKINAMGANRPETLPDVVIEQPGASQTNLRKWTDAQGRTHIEGGDIGVGGNGGRGGGGEYSGATAQAREVMAGIDDMVNNLVSNSKNYLPGGAMGKHARQLLANLTAQKVSLAGHALSGAATMEGHGVNAQINRDTRLETSAQRHEEANARLTETKRANDLHSADFNLRVAAQKDQKEADRLQKSFERGAYYEADPENPGNKTMNKKLTFFNMSESGETIKDPDTKADVEKVAQEFETYYRDTIKLNKGLSDNAATRKTIKAEWMKRQRIYK